MKVNFHIKRETVSVRMNRTELQLAIAALAASHAQAVQTGLRSQTETDFIVQAGQSVGIATLRGRLMLKQRSL